jgi:hypothetical protein
MKLEENVAEKIATTDAAAHNIWTAVIADKSSAPRASRVSHRGVSAIAAWRFSALWRGRSEAVPAYARIISALHHRAEPAGDCCGLTAAQTRILHLASPYRQSVYAECPERRNIRQLNGERARR